MTKIFYLFSTIVLSLALCLPALASNMNQQAKWDFSLGSGLIYNVPLPLTIRAAGHPTIKTTARWDTKPLTMPVYVQLRIARWQGGKAWEFEFMHHKLYLNNKPRNVQAFTITNGYNLFLINRAMQNKYFIWRVGLGWVLTHPESRVWGKSFSEHGGIPGFDTDGYFLSGAVAQIAIEKRLLLTKHVFVFAEGKMTAAYASVPIYGGNADVPNIAFHALVGVGATI